MNRWISAAGVTAAVLALAFFASNGIHTASPALSSRSDDAEVSVVKIVRRQRARPVQKAAAKPREKPKPKEPPKDTPVIPKQVEERVEEEEAAVEEVAEESQETAEEVAQIDDAETASDAESAAAADSGGASAETERSYKSYALSRIAGKKKYPVGARSKGQQGKVKMRIVIEPDGTLSDAGFVQESEFTLLNEASLSAVKKSAPFKKMPRGMKRQEYVFVIDYSLE